MRVFKHVWPWLALGLLMLPAATSWLDAVRTVSGRRHAYRTAERRVIVLGFDGVDPTILQEYLKRLPALAALARDGTLTTCRTTNPPESPVAWATFATGLNPGAHGIFDFVRRVPKSADSYRPQNGMVAKRPPKVGALGFPLRPPRAINLRGGEGFWQPVARLGYRVSVLRMPLTFPARLDRGGELLCGLGVPDLRATNGSYTLFAAGRDAWEGHTEFGGRHIKIYPKAGVAETVLEGPPDARDLPSGKRLTVPIRFTITGETVAATIDDGEAVSMEPGLYSPWAKVTFSMGPIIRVHGMVRFLLLRGGAEPSIYVSPIQIAPHTAPVPISSPESFAGELADRLGPMKTSGWPEDTFAANDRVLDDVQMFHEIRDTYRSHERLCLDRLDRSGASLLTMVFTAPDRMSHMFFRYRDTKHPAHDPAQIESFRERTGVTDPIFASYKWMNDTIASVSERLDDDDILIIVSDHGFHTWRTGINLNTWLMREGFLTLRDPTATRDTQRLNEFFGTGSPTAHVDWSKTKAYALGLGQIYLNLKGRERDGIVDPQKQESVLAAIGDRLMQLRGPDGTRAFTKIYRGKDIWRGGRMDAAPDLQCGFADQYRVSWQTALLGVPQTVFEANTLPWSGDHCSNDVTQTPGIFLSNRKLAPGSDPGLEDIAPTVCELFGAPPPKGGSGKALALSAAD